VDSVQEPLQSTETIVKTILPALKTFPTNEIAIIGCHSSSLARRSCEYDLLVISRDPIPEKFVSIADSYAEIMFRNEKEVRQPAPELAVTLASAVPLRDNSLLLASAISDCRRKYGANCASLLEAHLASSLKAVGRVDELLAANEAREADFWLLSAACEYAYAELLNSDIVPAPSHLLSQIKSVPKKKGVSFKSWADASGLELASRAACENRLEALSVVYDVLRTSAGSTETLPRLGKYADAEAFGLLRLKAEELIGSMQSVECFCYLGTETVRSVLDLYSLHAARLSKEKDYTKTIRDLTVGKDRLISEEVLKSLGLVRAPEVLRVATDELKAAVSALAKKI
jgi:hypothetical protein